MAQVRLIGVTFSFSDSVPILSDVNLHFGVGWTGVVGSNGAGKSTLLRLVAGELQPERGHVKFDPPGLALRLCGQTAEALTPQIAAFAAAGDGVSRRVQGQLRLDPGELGRWATLSAGERKRWQVGAALAAEPAVLMLDEPTDHLDAEARELVLKGLRGFRGVGIIVSHDRALLDELTSSIVHFHEGEVTQWRGAYETARASWEAEAREYHEAYLAVREEQRRTMARLDEKRRTAAGSDPRKSLPRRKGIHDHDSRDMFARGKARMASARISREAGVLRKKAERIASQVSGFHFRKTPGRSLFVDYAPAPVPRILSLDADEIRAGDTLILRDVRVAVMRQDRIRVAGPNGIGKSTLLNALVSNARLAPSRLLYLPQELYPEQVAAMLESVRELPSGSDRDRVLTLVAALGVDPGRLLESERPSPGEARKLALAWGLGRQVWGLVLDEPTNHLDMPAIERLEAALTDYPGALVMVTHDETLARRCTTVEWRLIERRVVVSSVRGCAGDR